MWGGEGDEKGRLCFEGAVMGKGRKGRLLKGKGLARREAMMDLRTS